MHCQTKENTLALLNEKHYSLLQNTISYFLTWQRRKAQSRVHTTETFYVMSILSRIQCYSRNVGFCHSVLLQRSDSSSNKGLQDLKSEMGLGSKFYRCDKKVSHYFILFYFILFYFRFVVISFSFHFRSSLESVAKHSWIIVCMTKLCYLVHDVYIFSYGNLCFRLPTLQGILPKYRHSCFLRQQMNLNMRGTKLVSLLKVSKKENPSPSS